MATYKIDSKKYRESTGLVDAVITGYGILDGYKVAIAVMDFGFLAADHGIGRWREDYRAIEYGTAQRCAVVIVAASGGARMYEGMLSLMQMAKNKRRSRPARPGTAPIYFCSDKPNDRWSQWPASLRWATLFIAEPKSMIGFAGPRVIKETTHQELPERFQTAEFLQEHGLIDLIVHRKKMREQISQLFSYFRCRGVNVGGVLVPRPRLSYKEALAWLYSLQRFGIKLGLENTLRLSREAARHSGELTRLACSVQWPVRTPLRMLASFTSPARNGKGFHLRHDRCNLSSARISHRPIHLPSPRHASANGFAPTAK